MSQRQAILNGVKCATASHNRIGVRDAIENGLRSNVDVFGSILSETLFYFPARKICLEPVWMGAELLFRPIAPFLSSGSPVPTSLVPLN